MSARAPLPPLRREVTATVGAAIRAPALVLDRERAVEPREIIVVPGYLTGDAATAALRAYLARLGHAVRGWGLGVHRGGSVQRLAARVAEQAARRPGPVTLIGWSLGGVVAREAARALPGHVAHVITLATPVVEGHRATRFGPLMARLGVDLDAAAARIHARGAVPVPVTGLPPRRGGRVAGLPGSPPRRPLHPRGGGGRAPGHGPGSAGAAPGRTPPVTVETEERCSKVGREKGRKGQGARPPA
ncbi:MAG: hypothetical protein H6706_05905 [Myxococcales bacterium]|nr:hypothetical protein [Myxococcales bacterium]